jgi:uncharacterized protein (UPF0548 family)
MFLLRQPSDAQVRNLLRTQRDLPFSYPIVGATRDVAPAGWLADKSRVRLGAGGQVFNAAVAAMRRWAMFDLGWVRLCWPKTPVETGAVVAVIARLPGIAVFNAARIVYTVDEGADSGSVRRVGFAYGTLPLHVERGEERFMIEWRRDDDSVWYDILALSRPGHPLVWAGFPIVRLLQRRFAHDSLAAMVKAVSAGIA